MMESMADFWQGSPRDTVRLLFFELEYALSTEVELGTPTWYLAKVVYEWADVLHEMGHIDEEEMWQASSIARKVLNEVVA